MSEYIIEPYYKQPNFLLTMSQASRVLGRKDYRLAEKLIGQGMLKTYSIPGSKRVLVKYHDVMSLPQKEKES
jgi:hypothetical protein